MSAVAMHGEYDVTNVPLIARRSILLGLIESVIIAIGAVLSRLVGGALEFVVLGLVVVVGLAIVTMMPGIWTRARTIEGIAGAAGIGLGAAGVFLLVDVALLQPLGLWTNRWHAIGGNTNWWYHPVWWMVGTFLPWMGAFILASQEARRGRTAPAAGFGLALAAAVVVGVIAVLAGFPGAGWNLGTFAVAFLPGVAIAALVGWMTARRA
ncbi:MAG: hypothetical protein M3Y31_05760 [Gemmatimonadota bacterium]|nr:hypothetical protein [Gemmatimonadota bacterium]